MSVDRTDYQHCPASATTTCAGLGVGRVGDILEDVEITPLTENPGAVSIKDGADAAIPIFVGGTGLPGLIADLVPFHVPFGGRARTGAWQIVCGANVQARAGGRFS